ncbi:cation diffusion facilitator family transporter [bacterium]|nr:cation diffusion facilitator family transporter [bacterium]
MASGSKVAVYSAIIGNSIVMVAKFIAFFFTGSSSMLSEGIHSFADVSNQCLLALGIQKSQRKADARHPYGYVRERYIWALISAVGIFFLGCGVTVYHGVHGLFDPHEIEDYTLAFAVLAFAFVVEGTTFIIALKAVQKEALKRQQSFFSYFKGGTDPTGVAVILEDGAAVLGVIIAAVGLTFSYHTHNPFWDSMATIMIGLLLGVVATFIAVRTRGLLIGQAIPEVSRKKVLEILQTEPVIDQVYDIKTAIIGAQDLLFKADVEFDGEKIAEKYIQDYDFNQLIDDLKTRDDLRKFLLEYGDHVIETLGDEIDRIEKKIKHEIPDLKHIDLEVN